MTSLTGATTPPFHHHHLIAASFRFTDRYWNERGRLLPPSFLTLPPSLPLSYLTILPLIFPVMLPSFFSLPSSLPFPGCRQPALPLLYLRCEQTQPATQPWPTRRTMGSGLHNGQECVNTSRSGLYAVRDEGSVRPVTKGRKVGNLNNLLSVLKNKLQVTRNDDKYWEFGVSH